MDRDGQEGSVLLSLVCQLECWGLIYGLVYLSQFYLGQFNLPYLFESTIIVGPKTWLEPAAGDDFPSTCFAAESGNFSKLLVASDTQPLTSNFSTRSLGSDCRRFLSIMT